MNSQLSRGRSILYPAFLALYIMWEITGLSFLKVVFGIFLIGLILQAIPDSSTMNRLVALVLFSSGIACLYFTGASAGAWLTALTNNGGLVAFFISLPFFNFILTYHDYRSAIKNIFELHIKKGSGFNILTAWLCFVLGAILNVAAIHMLYHLLCDNAESYGVKKGFYQALIRGNMAAVFWAPNFMAVATVLTYMKLSWLDIAPLGFLLSLFLMIIISGVFIFSRDKGNDVLVRRKMSKGTGDSSTKVLYHLLIVYSGLITLVVLLNLFTNYQILTIVAIAALTYPLGLALVERKTAQYKKELKVYLEITLPNIKNEIILFASVGFFGKALDITGVGSLIFKYSHLNDISNSSLAILAIIALMSIPSVFGIHPIVSISAFASSMEYGDFGLSVLAFAYTLLLGYATAVIVSPFSALSLVMSGITGGSPWETPRLNWILAVSVTVLFSLLLPLV